MFEENGYTVVRNVISKDVAHFICTEFELLQNVATLNSTEKFKFSDGQVSNSFSWYAPFCFETLLLNLQDKIEKAVNKKLFPVFSYGRIYYNEAELLPHKDRLGTDYAVTVCLYQETPWSIWFKDFKNNTQELKLEVGDVCIYRGNELEHWREKYKGNKHIQAFLFYVDADGKNNYMKYDTRPFLGLPGSTKKINTKNYSEVAQR